MSICLTHWQRSVCSSSEIWKDQSYKPLGRPDVLRSHLTEWLHWCQVAWGHPTLNAGKLGLLWDRLALCSVHMLLASISNSEQRAPWIIYPPGSQQWILVIHITDVGHHMPHTCIHTCTHPWLVAISSYAHRFWQTWSCGVDWYSQWSQLTGKAGDHCSVQNGAGALW